MWAQVEARGPSAAEQSGEQSGELNAQHEAFRQYDAEHEDHAELWALPAFEIDSDAAGSGGQMYRSTSTSTRWTSSWRST